jgi:hypothetical protein
MLRASDYTVIRLNITVLADKLKGIKTRDLSIAEQECRSFHAQ